MNSASDKNSLKIAYKRRNVYFSKSYRPWIVLIFVFAVVASLFLYIQTRKVDNNALPKSMHQFAKELHGVDKHQPDEEHRNFCEVIHIGIVCSGYTSNVHFHAMLKSMLLTRVNPIHLHILVSSESSTVLRLLLKSWQLPQVNVTFYNINKWLKDVRWVPNGHYSGNYGLLKLIFNKVVPLTVTKKLLILDTDLIINSDIYLLWKHFDNFSYKQIIGIGENQSPYYLGQLNQHNPWPAIGTGFNSGVMLYDLEKLKSIKWEAIWVNLTKHFTQIYGQTDLGDQDILNSIIKELPDIVYKLPCYWNVQMSSFSTGSSCYSKFKPRILHWNSPQKYSVPTKDGELFRGVATSVFEFNGNWFRTYPQLCTADQAIIDFNCILPWDIYGLLGAIWAFNQLESSDDCEKFSKPSYNSYRTLLFFLDYKFIADDWDITYVTHLSYSRIYLLEHIAKTWTGPISFTLYVSDAELVKTMRLITDSEILNRRTDIAYHAVFQQGEFYPINILRNVGLKHVKTPYSFLVDVDFTPMKSLFETLRDNIKNMGDFSKKALIVAAFEPTKSDLELPQTKLQLLESLDKSEIRPFLSETWPAGHSPTNYEKWRAEYDPYHVKWQPHYEPYIVVKSTVPLYDERFLGFGWNKVSHIMELEAQNYDFIVLPDAFIIHTPHPISWDNVKFKQSALYRRCSLLLKRKFIKQLSIKYNRNFSDISVTDNYQKNRVRRASEVKIPSTTTTLYDSTDFFLVWGGKEKAERKKEPRKRLYKPESLKNSSNLNVEYDYYYYDSEPPYNLTVLKRNTSQKFNMKLKETNLESSEEHNYDYDEDDVKFKEMHDKTTTPFNIEEDSTQVSGDDLISPEKNFTVKFFDEKLKH